MDLVDLGDLDDLVYRGGSWRLSSVPPQAAHKSIPCIGMDNSGRE